ncbi:MAG TPA: hypothetical protein VFU15_05640 [Bacteroidia bacterium]|nr:hypothetical protein [Bacteroidia bacterium]
MSRFLFMAGCLLFTLRAFAQQDTAGNAPRYVVLPGVKENFLLSGYSKYNCWDADSSVIAFAFSHLREGLDSLQKVNEKNFVMAEDFRNMRPFGQYHFQVLGMQDKNKEHLLLFNATCDLRDVNDITWNTYILKVYDGGPCYFSVVYNVTAGRWEMLYFNGTR